MNFKEKYATIVRMYRRAYLTRNNEQLTKWSKRANALYRECWEKNEMLRTYERETVLFLLATHEDLYSISYESFAGVCALHKAISID